MQYHYFLALSVQAKALFVPSPYFQQPSFMSDLDVQIPTAFGMLPC